MARLSAQRPGVPYVSMVALVTAVLAMLASIAGQASRQPAQENQLRGRDLVLDAPGAESGPAPTMPRGYALVVGVGEYRNLDESRQLLYAQSDAEAMYRVLISPEGGQFSS